MSRQLREFPKYAPEQLPPLEEALEYWRTSFYDESLLEARSQVLNGVQIPTGFLGYVYGLSKEFNGRVAVLKHEASLSANEKQLILEREMEKIKRQTGSDDVPLALRTITLAFRSQTGPRAVLVAAAGDIKVDNDLKRKIGGELGLPNSLTKRSEINPPDINPMFLVRLPNGIVGPFVDRGVVNLSGIFYLRERQSTHRLVAIAATPWETLVVEQSAFLLSVNHWHQKNTQHVPLRSIAA